ncbi:sugar phosphate isomerase/epimerase family protein [Paracoccaceae bacterium GXU_MW_L88]
MTFRTFKFGLMAGAALMMSAPGAMAQDDAERVTGELPIAVQLYTMRDFGTLDEQLGAVEAAGVTAVETVGTHDITAEELSELMNAHNIQAISTHAQIDDLRADLQAVVDFNKAIGNSTITIPYLAEEARPEDAAGWEALGAEMKEMSDQLQEQDMRLAYHNHDFEMVEFDGKTALEIMLDAAGEDVMAQIDLAWVARGGHDPAEYLGRFQDRVFAVHAKDNAPEGENEDQRGFAALGEGVLDWAAILPAAEEAGVEWYIIEHDLPPAADEVVATGASFLTENLPEGATRD